MVDETWLKNWVNESVVYNWTGLSTGALAENFEKKEWSYDVTELEGNEFKYDENIADDADVILIYRDNSTFQKFRGRSKSNFINQWVKCYSVVFPYWSNVSNGWQLQDFINKYSWKKLVITDETVWNWSGINTEKLELNPLNVSDRENRLFKKQFNLFLSQIDKINEKCSEKWITDIVLVAFSWNNLDECLILSHSGVCETTDGNLYFWDKLSKNPLECKKINDDAVRFWINKFPDKKVIICKTGKYLGDSLFDIVNLDWTEIKWLDKALVITDRHYRVLPEFQSIEIAWASFEPGLANFLWDNSPLQKLDELRTSDSIDVLTNRVLDKYKNFIGWEK